MPSNKFNKSKKLKKEYKILDKLYFQCPNTQTDDYIKNALNIMTQFNILNMKYDDDNCIVYSFI